MSKRGASILVIDDEREIVRALQRSLTAHGYQVYAAGNGEDGLVLLEKQRPDLLLLDLMLPGMSGLEVCRQVRAVSALPILILSAKEAEQDKVQALDLGADDYIAKPFGIDEVLARIRVALRHVAQTQAGTSPSFQLGPLEVDFSARSVKLADKDVLLTPTEYDLLKAFITHRGKLLTRQMLIQELWGNQTHARMHSLHVYIAQLRQKIEPTPEHPRFIRTIPGVGYRFTEGIDSNLTSED